MLSDKTVIENLKKHLNRDALNRLSASLNIPVEAINAQLEGKEQLTVSTLLAASELLNIPVDRFFSSGTNLSGENIKLLVLDIDGVLTNGGMYYTESGDEFKKFNTKDGLAIKRLTSSGVQVAFLSSGINANLIGRRAELLGVQKVYTGFAPKLEVLTKWKEELNLTWDQIAFVGDDVNDLAVMKLCGVTACPADASPRIRQVSKMVLDKRGGEGCVRDFIETVFFEIH